MALASNGSVVRCTISKRSSLRVIVPSNRRKKRNANKIQTITKMVWTMVTVYRSVLSLKSRR